MQIIIIFILIFLNAFFAASEIAFISLNLLFHKICLISIITGFPCPGCGMTRAFVNLLTFHFKKAPRFCALFPVFRQMPQAAGGKLRRFPPVKITNPDAAFSRLPQDPAPAPRLFPAFRASVRPRRCA